MTLTGQVALVTGAVRDIGRAIALRLAQDGADVAVADLRADLLRDTAAAITGHERRSLAVPVDVTQKPQVEAMVQQVVSTFGRLDVFFNNAGVMKIHDFLDITEADWDWSMDINAIPYRTAQTSCGGLGAQFVRGVTLSCSPTHIGLDIERLQVQ